MSSINDVDNDPITKLQAKVDALTHQVESLTKSASLQNNGRLNDRFFATALFFVSIVGLSMTGYQLYLKSIPQTASATVESDVQEIRREHAQMESTQESVKDSLRDNSELLRKIDDKIDNGSMAQTGILAALTVMSGWIVKRTKK